MKSGSMPKTFITKKCLYNFDPLKPNFLYSKTGVYRGIFFSYFCSKHRLWNSLEPPRRGGSNEYLQSVLSRNMKNINFLSEIFHFLVVKLSVYLYRHVFVVLTFSSQGISIPSTV